jgi:hypothetical protein
LEFLVETRWHVSTQVGLFVDRRIHLFIISLKK